MLQRPPIARFGPVTGQLKRTHNASAINRSQILETPVGEQYGEEAKISQGAGGRKAHAVRQDNFAPARRQGSEETTDVTYAGIQKTKAQTETTCWIAC
jgi:hypothetical protein